MRISANQLNIQSFQESKGTAGLRRREQAVQKTPSPSQPVNVSLSSPVERILKRAVELYTSEADVREEQVERGKHVVANWSELTDRQIDDMLDSLSADVNLALSSNL